MRKIHHVSVFLQLTRTNPTIPASRMPFLMNQLQNSNSHFAIFSANGSFYLTPALVISPHPRTNAGKRGRPACQPHFLELGSWRFFGNW
jgi:hypothetical protein